MEARIKRLFHRKKDMSSDQALQHRRGSTKVAQSTPDLGTSLLDSTSPASPDTSRQTRKSSLNHHEREELLSENVPHGASLLPISRRNKRQTIQIIQPDSSEDGFAKNGPQQPTKQLNDLSTLSLEDKDSGHHMSKCSLSSRN